MDFSQNYENLLKHMNYKHDEKKVTHNNFKSSPLLPFQTRHPERVKFDNGFNSIIGEFARIELNKEWVDNFDINQLISSIINNNSVNVDGGEKHLEILLKQYLFNDKNELNILNPFLFLYIPLSDNKQATGEKDIALFLRDIFSQNNDELADFFKKDNSNHAIVNLILSNIAELNYRETGVKYKSLLPNIVDLFTQDINFAINYENFLIKDISNILSYYYFFYVSQLILKLNRDYDESVGEVEELFYLLDWESVSRNRKTVTGYGWDLLKNKSNHLAAKISVVDQLNILFGMENYSFLGDIFNEYDELPVAEQEEFIKYLKKWVYDYRIARGFEEITLPDDFKMLTKILYESLDDEKGIGAEIRTSRYPLNLEEVTKSFFAKGRGKYGYVLNISRDMLLTITSLCVKDKHIKLKQLFAEYEKRGLYFDYYSQMEIENFLTKLNLIDKKSDGGDAKYVKPIL